MINTIIFDVDGTLYDETIVKVKAELLTADYISRQSDLDAALIYNTFREVKAQITKGYKGMPEANDRVKWYEETLRRLGIEQVRKEDASEFYWKVIYESMELFVDFKFILPQLSAQYKLYVLTDELFEIHRRKLQQLGLENTFLRTISSEEAGATKPSPQLFHYALNIVGERPENVIMVGDNPSADILGGNSVGMHTAWLKRGKYFYYPQKESEKPEIAFTNYIQLISKIKKLV